MSDMHARFLAYVQERGMEMPHYTDGSKLTEETEELREALRNHITNSSAGSLFHLMDEAADVVITVLAVCNQFGFSIEDALDHKTAKDKGRGGVRVP